MKAIPAAIGLIALFMSAMVLIFKLGDGIQWLPEVLRAALNPLDAVFANGPFVAIPVIWLPMFLVLVAHEAGHAVVALFYKWPISEFRAYPFSFRKTQEGWKLLVSWNLWPGGLVVAQPSTFAGFHSRLRVYALGGPAMNLVTGMLGWLLCLASRGSLLLAIEVIFVIWSFLSAFLNLLPVRARNLELDGYIALIVSRNPRKLSTRLAAFTMLNHILSGKPVSSMNPRWVALAVDEASGAVPLQNQAGAWMAYIYWVQRRQLDRAAAVLERLLRASADVDVNFKAVLFAECSVLAALRGQARVAHTWKDRACEFFLAEYLRRRCNSYVAWVERDFEVAYREAVLAQDAVLKLDANTQKAFLPSWAPWIEVLDKARIPIAEPSTAGKAEVVFPYT
jgi:hypothetical protein